MIYSPFKAAHHLDRLEKLRKGELIMPTSVQIDPTNHCNHKCVYCFYRFCRNNKLNALFNEKDELPLERFESLFEEFVREGIKAVEFTGGGEPLMHPYFAEILRLANRNMLQTSLVTNGVLLGKLFGYHEHGLLSSLVWLRISLDAFTKETYSKVHSTPPNNFDRAISNLKTCVNDFKKTVIGVSYMVNPLNYKETLDCAKMLKDLGVANIRLTIAYTPQGIGLYKDIWDDVEKISRETKQLEDKNFKVFNFITSHLDNLDYKHKGYDFCGYQHFTAIIGADGRVYPCCTLKYNASIDFGSIIGNTFKEVWFGDRRKNWLKIDHLAAVCNKNPCWFDNKNKFISYLIKDNPPHVNWI